MYYKQKQFQDAEKEFKKAKELCEESKAPANSTE